MMRSGLRVAGLCFVLLLGAGCLDGGGGGEEEGTDPGPFPVPVLDPLLFEDTGMIMLGNDALGNTPTGCGNLGEEGLDTVTHSWEIPGEANGTAIRPVSLTATLVLEDPTLVDADLYVYGPDGTELGRSTAFNAQTGPSETLAIVEGLGAGAYSLVVRGCSGSGAYSLAAVAELVAVL